jgi:uncharacterized protein YkwD/uncharacterized membrane protein required for colicin V production
MNLVDGVILFALLLYAIGGFFRGIIQGFGSLFCLIVALGGTWMLYPPTTDLISRRLPGEAAHAVAFLGLLATLFFLCSLGFRTFYVSLPQNVRQSFANRFFGIFSGLTDGVIMIALVLAILIGLPSEKIPRRLIANSSLGRPLLSGGEAIQAKALERFGDAMRLFIPLRIVEPKPNERVRLPFRADDGKPDPDIEREMWSLVNAERTRRGIPPLKWDDRLMKVARGHSQDMFKRGYFSHYSPEGKTVADRVTAVGLKFTVVGENLALAPTLTIAHQGLMESPGHRANILNKEFTSVGIGAIVARPYGIMFTQAFAKDLAPAKPESASPGRLR